MITSLRGRSLGVSMIRTGRTSLNSEGEGRVVALEIRRGSSGYYVCHAARSPGARIFPNIARPGRLQVPNLNLNFGKNSLSTVSINACTT